MLVKYYAPVACIGHALHSSRHMLIPLSYKRVHDCSLLASFDIISEILVLYDHQGFYIHLLLL